MALIVGTLAACSTTSLPTADPSPIPELRPQGSQSTPAPIAAAAVSFPKSRWLPVAWSELPGYVVSQVLGAITGAGILYVIATGKAGADIGGFATNGFGTHSPGGYGMTAALVTEVVMTAFFILVILGATAKRAAAGFGGLAIGLCLTLIHLISIPVTNTSVNPARSTGPALFGPEIAVSQLWLFWVAPIVGALIGAVIYKALLSNPADE